MRAQLDRVAAAAAEKTRWLVIGMVAAWLAALAIFIGVTGCATTPTKFETRFYDIDTNQTAYTYTPNERARSVSAVAGTAAGLLGPVGELVALLCAGAFGVWGQIRSTRATRVAGVLAQVIETGRAVLQQSPQGRKLDEQWKSWMITHQAEQGVIEDVVKLLATVVDDGTAKEAAGKLVELMQERQPN